MKTAIFPSGWPYTRTVLRGLAALLAALATSTPGAAAPPPARATAAASTPAKAASAKPKPRARARPRAKPKNGVPTATRAEAAAPTPAEVAVTGAAAPPATDVVKTEELGAGEKAYTFGAQEVEGRLKSPQILYFLRRVRAEFEPAPLGHRSFLLELSDTRRHPAFE